VEKNNRLTFVESRVLDEKCSNNNSNNDQYLEEPKPEKEKCATLHMQKSNKH